MADPTVLMTGIAFGESPRWHDGRLWFSDWAAGEVIAVGLDGASEVMASIPSFPLCIDFLPDGSMLAVSGAEQRVVRRSADGSLETYADLDGISPHPWNDIVIDGRGNAYVNNIGFEFGSDVDGAPGFVCLVRPDGSVEPAADGLAFPNGMAVTPDNCTLIVAESYAGCLTAFDIADDGTVSNRRQWADLGDGAPDGICLDAEGAVWYADVGHRHARRVAEGGGVLQTVAFDRGCFACALGGADGRTLFVVGQHWDAASMGSGDASGQVTTVEVSSPGAGWP